MRRIVCVSLIVVAALAACDGGGGSAVDAAVDAAVGGDAGDVGAGDVGGPDARVMDATVDATADAAADLGPPPLDPFVVHPTVDSNIGVVGQAFALGATLAGEPPEGVRWAWSAPEGQLEAGDADRATVRFDAPGWYEITVIASGAGASVEAGVVVAVYPEAGGAPLGDVNGDGATDAADRARLAAALAGAAALDEDAEARADLNRDGEVDALDAALLDTLIAEGTLTLIEPLAGSRGTAVQILHPALLDPAGRFTAAFDDEEVPLTRGPPGYALALVPLARDQAGAAQLRLLQGDVEVHRFDFSVLAPPAAEGTEIPRAFEALQGAYEAMPPLVDAYLVAIDVPAEERALMTALLQASAEELARGRAEHQALWEMLSQEQQAIYAEVALANGLGDALAALDVIRAELGARPGQVSTEEMLRLICLAKDLKKVTKDISRANDIAGYAIDVLWFLSYFVPPLAPVVAGLSVASEFIGAVMDAMSLVLDFVPRLGNELVVTADPTALRRGDRAIFEARVPIHIAGGLCAGGAAVAVKRLVDRMKDRLFKRLFGRIPGFGKVYNRARGQRTLIARFVNIVTRLVGQIIDFLIEESELDERLKSLAAAVCGAASPEKPWLLDPSGVEWSASCGSADVGSWQCTEACGDHTVTMTATLRTCEQVIRGRATVECEGCRAQCPDGCCTAERECVREEAQSDRQCGAMGNRCQACADEQVCRDGRCACVSTCREDEVGTRRCADAETVETCEAAGDGCWRWTQRDCAEGGARCEEGECVGGCGDWNCDGCCTAAHDCVEVPSQGEAQCGLGGSRCAACAQGDRCVGGVCVCRGAHCDQRPRAGTRGDPHLITFDGLAYDFQAAGEFVLVTGDGMEIQVRQVPLVNPTCAGTVSINRAAAVRMGDVRITYDPQRRHPIWVDGVAVQPPRFELWPVGGGALQDIENGLMIRWPDESLLWIDAGRALDLSVRVADGRAVTGLLGSNDGDRTNDIRIRGGEPLGRPAPFGRLYGEFADSWRVTEQTSLFDYSPGEGPGTFHIAEYPRSVATVEALAPDARAEAEAICADVGIEDPTLFAACVLDVACTGDASYAAGLSGVEPPDEALDVLEPGAADACARTGTDLIFDPEAEACRVNFEGREFLYCHDCPPGCEPGPVWGTDRYHEGSTLCTAAVHAGTLDAGAGGRIYFIFPEWDGPYVGSERNGVESLDRAPFPVSILFTDDPSRPLVP